VFTARTLQKGFHTNATFKINNKREILNTYGAKRAVKFSLMEILVWTANALIFASRAQFSLLCIGYVPPTGKDEREKYGLDP